MVYTRSTTDNSPVASCDVEEFHHTNNKRTPANAAASRKYNPNIIENELEALGPPSYSGPKYTTERFVELVKNNNTQIISLLHVGEDSLIKTLDFCPANETNLISILEGGERCDGSSIFPNSGIEASSSDIVLRPRLDTAFFDPFAPTPKSVLCFFCWHYGTDGHLLPQSPETIIHRAEEELLKEGHILWSHGEIEFFLGKKVINRLENGLLGSDHGYHAAAPYVFGQDLRREAIAILARIGVHVKYGHSENAYIPADQTDPITWEQHEIELSLEPLNKAARSSILTKWVLSTLAQKYDMQISFDPICKEGHVGSGFHVHMSPRHGNGPNDFILIRDEKSGALAPEAVRLIAGLSRVGGALMAFGNRTETSFIRLNQGKEAPSTVCWGDRNRRALIRLPLVAKNEAGELVAPPTVEFRLGDGSANPYLLMAGLAMAMHHGAAMTYGDVLDLVAATEARPHSNDSNLKVQRKVPQTRDEVAAELRNFRESFEIAGVFPKAMIDAFIGERCR